MAAVNQQLNPEFSVGRARWSAREIAVRLAEHILERNPAEKVHYQPRVRHEGIRFTSTKGFLHVDLKKFYPDALPGNTVFCACDILSPEDSPMAVAVSGNVRVWYAGQSVFSALDGGAKGENGHEIREIDAYPQVTGVSKAYIVQVQIKKGRENRLVVETVCDGEAFGFALNISHPANLMVWPQDYITWMRAVNPVPFFGNEEGFAVSTLYADRERGEKEFWVRPSYVWPKEEKEGTDFDLSGLYGEGPGKDGPGRLAYSYTEAIRDGSAELTAKGSVRIAVNGTLFAALSVGKTETVRFKKGDRILIKCLREGSNWGFRVSDKRFLGLPSVRMTPERDLHFLFCGPFYQEGFHTRLEPEYEYRLNRPYPDGRGGKVYWRFFLNDTFLRPYLDSNVYGQWYYADMLTARGLGKAGQQLDNEEYDRYLYDCMHQMAEFDEYILLDKQIYGSESFMAYSDYQIFLDFIGTMGLNFTDAYLASRDPIFWPVLERLRHGIDTVVPRFEDGTFCRRQNNTMWADDLFMGCPFLACIAQYSGDTSYFAEAVKQIRGFKERLYIPEEKLFSHIYFMKEETPNRIPWGRANGWALFSMSEVLKRLPEDHPGRQEVLAVFQDLAEGIRACQDPVGLWHQVLDRPETYLETSCTAMFLIGILRGLKEGWLDVSYAETANLAWEALKNRCIDVNGSIYGICMGSGCSMDAGYYAKIPTMTDDDHGTSVTLMAVCEWIGWENRNG